MGSSDQIHFNKVLVIDTNEQHQKVIAGSLGRLVKGIDVKFHNLKQSPLPEDVQKLADNDLLFVDVGEDKSLVKEWYSALSKQDGLPPVIFLDSRATSDDAVDIMRLGAADYLNKRGLSDSRLLQSLQAVSSQLQVTGAVEEHDPSDTTGVIMADKVRAATENAAASENNLPVSDSDDSSTSWFKLPSISDDFPITPEDISAGEATMGNYRILEFLGMGGNTQVFKAESIDTKEIVAIKILSPTKGKDESSRDRFVREYEMIKNLNHPHVITSYQQDTEGDWPYIVMEYCPRGDLKTRMKQKISRETAIKYTAQIAAGLDSAHRQGLIHRDVKPSNILIRQDNSLVLVDFGIVKSKTVDQQALTDEGKMVGTPYYISPEQARGGKLDGRSDLYSLGIILYEMLEGKKPFTGDTPIDVIFSHVQDPIPKLTQEWDILNDVIGRLLDKDRDERYATGMELIEELYKVSPESVDQSLLTQKTNT